MMQRLGPMFVCLRLILVQPAHAQLQMQGQTVGSPPTAGSPGPPSAPKENAKQKKARCTRQAKDDKLRGAKRTAAIKSCMND
jgi:hypothetical protein